jgi:hypothetical protein
MPWIAKSHERQFSASKARSARSNEDCGPAAVPVTPDSAYFLFQFADDEVPEPAALAFFASRFSFRDLLAAVFELFEPPLSLLAMVTSFKRKTGC